MSTMSYFEEAFLECTIHSSEEESGGVTPKLIHLPSPSPTNSISTLLLEDELLLTAADGDELVDWDSILTSTYNHKHENVELHYSLSPA